MTFSRPRAVGPAFAPMAPPPKSFDPLAASFIATCTRNGKTSWNAVANMMGRCVHSVRSDYDPTYLKSEKPA